jgi:pimeloyl-ACP methyl ester carboxylesterase
MSNELRTWTFETSAGRMVGSESAGRAAGAVLVHGNSGSRRVWDAVMRGPLGARRRLVALDLPGHGDAGSATWGDDALAALARALAEAIGETGCERAVVVGHSLGGHLALQAMAAGGLGSVRGLFLHGTPPLGGPADFPRAFRPSAVMGTGFEAAPNDEALAALVQAWYGPHRAPPVEASQDFRRTQADIRPGIAQAIGTGRMADERAVVAALTVPIALVQSADDPFIAFEYLDALPAPTRWRGAVHVLPDCGHFPQWEAPERFGSLLDAFLGDVYGDAG